MSPCYVLPTAYISLEEHATFPALGDQSPFYDEIWFTKNVRGDLLDMADGRLKDMAAGHVSFQVLSHLPGIANASPVQNCRTANNQMASAIRNNPTSLGGFAALPMQDPNTAVLELQRAVTELGLLGAMIDSRLPDLSHYEKRQYWPNVPISIHLSPAPDKLMQENFDGEYAQYRATGLSTGAWGWHVDVGLHVVKLFAAGGFKEFPRLKIVIGHMGEMLPMMVGRIDRLKFFHRGGLGSFRHVRDTNIWVTTSGIFSVRTLKLLLHVIPLERVIFSVGTPFEKGETGWSFVEAIAQDGMLTTEELNQMVLGNAKRSLKLPDHIASTV